ncbi:MAG: hypothetical protein COX51_03865 [Syntrophobacteraceae bacterium CG23_combo_of_CG06-09_8_20_14_all_50_8]|nr:MAG: hypothetical protein COX51_03865 [Syntrophobacteraceae bacterium CG23_combo_of_CG06-09_8_20_14_all_50_8]
MMGAMMKTAEVWQVEVVRSLSFSPDEKSVSDTVIDGKNLKMKILVQKDKVDLSRTVQGNPFIIKKQTETTLIVEDGETIVISGLSKQTNSNLTSGIPWLKDIPGLGWLFKGEGKGDKMEEVLVFITPTILPPRKIAATFEGQDKEPKTSP